ncbi:hypothetical protein MLD38_010682 [Melastoma candidum]|uniref:Uncharacterized protein n=1 Tax=Melastoma candidum TaxID=119954 RepID=A0ACB9R164_9MYRT|nr:hypothetical protein MLD38_010682 [Melastoma candidum]
MGGKEMTHLHAPCCITAIPPLAADSDHRRPLHHEDDRIPRSLPVVPSVNSLSAPVAGVLCKWTNYGKGWRWRWFLFKDDVLYYSKIRRSRCVTGLLARDGDEVTVIGSDDRRGTSGIEEDRPGEFAGKGWVAIMQMKVSSFRESKSDERRFYVFAETKTLHLKAKSSGDRAAWRDSCVLTESLKERLVREGVREDVVRDCERIMLSEFSRVQGRLRLLCQERSGLLDALRQRETYNTEAKAAVIHGNGHILTKHDLASLGLAKYCEYSTTESSDDIEKQEAEDASEEDEIYFFDTEEHFHQEPGGVTCDTVTRYGNEADRVMTSDDCCNNMNMHRQEENCGGRDLSMGRRTKLPDPMEKEKGVNLWSLIKDCVGKDLTRVCLPVYFNEPISSLQKCFEEFEYSHLLDQAHTHGKAGNSLMRALYVAAFAVSGYSSSKGRPCKPFNPLLGETYEAEYPEKGVRFISEKVSHHPTLIACQCEGRGWEFWGDSNIKTKFWGQSIQLNPVGELNLRFDDGEIFTWNKVTTSINNLILGKVCCDHHGTMHIRGNREYSCNLRFKDSTIFDRHSHEVHGSVEDVNGRKVAIVFGKWDEAMYYVCGERGPIKIKGNKVPSDATLLWKSNETPPNLTRYNLSSFAITLNELTPGLQEKLPPTDSRLRPDQRHLENGEYEKANAEKQRLEKRQRMSRKIQESGWEPRWFRREGEGGPFRYTGGYWESREQTQWDGCPNIYGEFIEDAVDESTSEL